MRALCVLSVLVAVGLMVVRARTRILTAGYREAALTDRIARAREQRCRLRILYQRLISADCLRSALERSGRALKPAVLAAVDPSPQAATDGEDVCCAASR